MAAPSISSASLASELLTINGADFGVKTTAAPAKFRDWTGLTDGSNAQALAQFDETEFVNFGGGSTFTVDNSKGWGGGSLKIVANCQAVGEIFPHHCHNGFSSDVIYMSSWLLVNRVTNVNSTTLAQFKSFRLVKDTGGGPVDNYYNGRPMLQMSLSSTEPDDNGSFILGSWDSSGARHGDWTNEVGGVPQNMPPFMRDGLPHLVEQISQLNSVGVANGLIDVYIDGAHIASYTNMQNKDGSGEHFSYALWGTDFADDMQQNNWITNEGRHYLDTTIARVFLSDSATFAGIATPSFLVPPVTWTGGNAITVTAKNIPANYKYLYVVNSAGEVNSSGYLYTSGNTPTGGIIQALKRAIVKSLRKGVKR